MTADDLLEQVVAQFQVMLLSPEAQASILAQVLRVCQAKMGPFTEITCDGTVDTPADFLSVASAMDANGRWQDVVRVKTAAIPETETDAAVAATDKLQIVGQVPVDPPVLSPLEVALTVGNRNGFYGAGRVASTKAVKPFRIFYFIDLAQCEELPPLVQSYLYEYLYIRLEIPNNKRSREVASTTGMQVELPSDEELKQRKDLIETDMEESAAIIPSAAVF